MEEHYPPIFVDATPDDILAILRDDYRQQCTWDPEVEPDVVLSRDTTVAQWRDACDLIGWEPLAAAFNKHWSVPIPRSQWRRVLTPPKKCTLGGVCDLLAQYVKVPVVRPVAILGGECLAAGTFLTIRSYLSAAGADVSDVSPSTPLAEYARRHTNVFLGPVAQLAPGALPLAKIRSPFCSWNTTVLCLAVLGMMVGVCMNQWMLILPSGLVAMTAFIRNWIVERVLPTSVEFGRLTTFRDLSKVIAAGARR